MKVGVVAENLLERALLWKGALPTPVFETVSAMMLSRAIVDGVKLGIFDALESGPLEAERLAQSCGLDGAATPRFLRYLASLGYLRQHGSRFELTPVARKWLVQSSASSVRDFVLFQDLQWRWFQQMSEYVRVGRTLDMHGEMSSQDWQVYQRAMRAMAGFTAEETARRIPIRSGRASDMLDIGGSHGFYSVVLCRRHPGLRSTILELPKAIEYAAPLLAREQMETRIEYRPGNLTTDALGTSSYDLVLMANIVHHFDESTNRDLMRRVADSLRPGGVAAIQDFVRPETAHDPSNRVTSESDLYFSFMSAVGTWSVREMTDWLTAAGLQHVRPIRLLSSPGTYLVVAEKP